MEGVGLVVAAAAEPGAPGVVVKALLGLTALVVLAYLGGHPVVRRLELRLGVSRVVAAGLPFLLLGLLARHDAIGVLSDRTVDHLRPVLHLGLGWIGLVVGMRVRLDQLGELPRGTSTILAIGTGLPFAALLGVGLVVLGLGRWAVGLDMFEVALLRDALLLATAGAVAADTESLRLAAKSVAAPVRRALAQLTSLEELIGLLGLGLLTAYFRPASSWTLPETAWLFITFGLPAVVGCVVYAILRVPASSSESVALLLGVVAFTAGMASELRLSALVVCFVVGVLLTNFPGDYHERVRELLERLETSIYLLFLVVAGALWDPSGALGWALMILVIATRLLARWAAGRVVWRRIDVAWPPDARRALVVSPLGTLPIAIVVNAMLLYPGEPGMSAVFTAIIAGAFLSEVIVQLYWRAGGSPGAPTEVP